MKKKEQNLKNYALGIQNNFQDILIIKKQSSKVYLQYATFHLSKKDIEKYMCICLLVKEKHSY